MNEWVNEWRKAKGERATKREATYREPKAKLSKDEQALEMARE